VHTRELVDIRTDNEANHLVVSLTGGLKFLLCVSNGFVNVQAVEVNRSLLVTLGMTIVEHDVGNLNKWKLHAYLILMLKNDVCCLHIQLIHCAPTSLCHLLMHTFSCDVSSFVRTLGPHARIAHLATLA
jgi:hypothetical protein